jgi:hypothetical protein
VEGVIGGSADGIGHCVLAVVLLKCESSFHLSLVMPTNLTQNTDMLFKAIVLSPPEVRALSWLFGMNCYGLSTSKLQDRN